MKKIIAGLLMEFSSALREFFLNRMKTSQNSLVFVFLVISEFFSKLCWGKAMMVFTKLQQTKKEESERLRGEI